MLLRMRRSDMIQEPRGITNDNEKIKHSKSDKNLRAAELGVVTGGNDLSAVKSITAANNSAANSTSGHGIMAEEALTVIDKFLGRAAEVVGRSNEKNGADRMVDGVYFQTKFYSSGKGCIDACFESASDGGMYRYMNADGTPMPVEVPKDMYDEAVARFAEKISAGKVEGLSNTADAERYVAASRITYDDAKALCRPMTAQSLIYDAVTGAVHCSFAFGISAAAAFIIIFRKSGNLKKAAAAALKSGIKVFGLTYICSILSSQLARTAFMNSVFDMTEKLCESNVSASLVKEISNGLSLAVGDTVYSVSAAARRFAKILGMGFIVNLISLIVFIIPDTVRLCFGRISAREFLGRAFELICARIFASAAAAGAAVIFSGLMAMPCIVSTLICLAAACVGAMYGRKFACKLRRKFNKGLEKGAIA